MSKRLFAAFVLIGTLPITAAGQPNGEEPPRGPLQAILEAHNEVRAAKGVAGLAWSQALAESAGDWAAELARDATCEVFHSDTSYGENLYQCWGACKPNKKWLRKAVEKWSGEAVWYDDRTDRCSAPAGASCRHYNQVVWCATNLLGCGYAACGKSVIVICHYDPPGNWTGQSPFECPGDE